MFKGVSQPDLVIIGLSVADTSIRDMQALLGALPPRAGLLQPPGVSRFAIAVALATRLQEVVFIPLHLVL